jgi:chitinase
MFWEISGDDEDGSLLSALISGNPAEPYTTPQELNLDGYLVPEISIDEPLNCSISLEGFNVVINESSTPPEGEEIKQVEFFHEGGSLGFDNRPPWSWAWFNLPEGKHELTAEVTLTDGSWNLSNLVNITVYGASSDVSLWQTGVSYQNGDEVFYQGCIYSAKRNHVGSRVRTPSSGRYWSLVTCTDPNCGGGTSGNQAPVVNFLSPVNDTSFADGDDIYIVVEAIDDGPVDSISIGFSPDSNIPCLLAQEPGADQYSCTWTGAPVGPHQLTVVATDDLDDSGNASINIVVLVDGSCSQPWPWSSTTTYYKGDEVSHTGIKWRSKRTNQNVEPGTSPSKWSNLGPC